MFAFTKMNGAGNDFVMIDNRSGNFAYDKNRIAHLCDRHRGVGADGLIAAEPSTDARAHLRMRYFNADGGEAEMCGNGARCFARFGARLLGLSDLIVFETLAGTLTANLHGDRVQLAMSPPHGMALGTSLSAAGETLPALAGYSQKSFGIPLFKRRKHALDSPDPGLLGFRIC